MWLSLSGSSGLSRGPGGNCGARGPVRYSGCSSGCGGSGLGRCGSNGKVVLGHYLACRKGRKCIYL